MIRREPADYFTKNDQKSHDDYLPFDVLKKEDPP